MIAGSDHVVDVLDEVVGPGPHAARVVVIPPGVDVDVCDRATAGRGTRGR